MGSHGKHQAALSASHICLKVHYIFPQSYRRAVSLAPHMAAARINLGAVLHMQVSPCVRAKGCRIASHSCVVVLRYFVEFSSVVGAAILLNE